MLKGFDSRITISGLLFSIGSAFFSGLVYVIIRKIGKTEHPVVVVNYFMCISLLFGGIFSMNNWVQPVGIEWIILLTMGLFGFWAQIFMTKGLQLFETNLITPFKYFEVIFTILSGWIFFGEYQTWFTVAAMGMIIISLLANVMVKKNK